MSLPGTYERCMSGHYFARVRGDEECPVCLRIGKLEAENAQLKRDAACFAALYEIAEWESDEDFGGDWLINLVDSHSPIKDRERFRKAIEARISA